MKTSPRTTKWGCSIQVTVYFEEDDEEETFQLVTTLRQDALQGRISKESPVGQALFGHRVGERVMVKVNESRSYPLVIRKIEKCSRGRVGAHQSLLMRKIHLVPIPHLCYSKQRHTQRHFSHE